METFPVMTISRKTFFLLLMAWPSSPVEAVDQRRIENVDIDLNGLEVVIDCDSDSLSKIGVSSGDIGRAVGMLLDSGSLTYDAIRRLKIETQEGKRVDLAMLPVKLAIRRHRETPRADEANLKMFTVPRSSIKPMLIRKQGYSKKEKPSLLEDVAVLLKSRRSIDLRMKITIEGRDHLFFDYFALIVKL